MDPSRGRPPIVPALRRGRRENLLPMFDRITKVDYLSRSIRCCTPLPPNDPLFMARGIDIVPIDNNAEHVLGLCQE